MKTLSSLPAELIAIIFALLERADLKRVRQLSKVFRALATPDVFRELFVDITKRGSEGLAAIADRSELQNHVLTVHLRVRNFIHDFQSYEKWRLAILDGGCVRSSDLIGQQPTTPDVTELSKLFKRYERDRLEANEYTSRLASAMSQLLAEGSCGQLGTQSRHETTDAQRALETFVTAVTALTRVQSLVHTPISKSHRWRTWNQVEFHVKARLNHDNYQNKTDALHLFIALHAVLRAPNSLRSIEMSMFESVFWGASDWVSLLSSEYFDCTKPQNIAARAQRTFQPQTVPPRLEVFMGDLSVTEPAFRRITHLECRIEMADAESKKQVITIAERLSSAVKDAVNLERLGLSFHESPVGDGRFTYFNAEFRPIYSFRHSRKSRYFRHLYSANSTRMLLNPTPMQHLQWLSLSFVTSAAELIEFFKPLRQLCHLRVYNATVLPERGSWDNVFDWLHNHRSPLLDCIELFDLEDVKDEQPRLLLCPKAPIWAANDANVMLYAKYEMAIIQYALGKITAAPILSPEEFIASGGRLTLARDTMSGF